MAERVLSTPLPNPQKSSKVDSIQVSRADLEAERRHILGRLQQLHRLLGYPPIATGKEQRRQLNK